MTLKLRHSSMILAHAKHAEFLVHMKLQDLINDILAVSAS